MDQIRKAEVAWAQWQLWWKPETPDERFPKEYCEIVGIDDTATYMDAWNQIEEDLEGLEEHFEMLAFYEQCEEYDEDDDE